MKHFQSCTCRYYYHRFSWQNYSRQILSQCWTLLTYSPTFYIMLIFVFIIWIRFTHRQRNFLKEGKREGRESLTWVSVIGPTMSLGKKDEWRGNQTKTQPDVISKSKLFLKTYKCSKSPGGDRKRVIADTYCHTHKGGCVEQTYVPTTISNSTAIPYMQCKTAFHNTDKGIDMKKNL